ncbi:MAG TPA: DUF3182 family protein [Burkholderiales bacterium]|nr:DUF3182 family protein [Burkholderiales bacterium]
MVEPAPTDPAHRAGDVTRGDVVVYRGAASTRPAHDHATCSAIARRLAAIKGYDFAGDYDAETAPSRARYFVPLDTLIGVEHARSLGIDGEHDLFGGVAPHPFVATKCISHALVDGKARAPAGWSDQFARRVRPAVLRGYTAFGADDALRAASRLLAHGPVRIKRALASGGSGQWVVSDRDALVQVLAGADPDEVARYGLALEQHLEEVTTRSVGQVRVGDLVASYCGTQRLTQNNAGEDVYGGSVLEVVRGGFDALLARTDDPAARRAIDQARLYDRAAFECFTGLLASRRNYDVAQGRDAAGRARSGVLEQSWRVGGASGAEVEALAAFCADPTLRSVRASTNEVYGTEAPIPAGATVYFRGDDARAGPLTKYTMIDRHADA